MQYRQQKINADCIIAAAGLSSRMGDWKLMLSYNNSTIVEESINNALAICERVILVVGYRSDELIEKVKSIPNIKIVINDDYQSGMYSSIRQGVKEVNSDYFFICHADMPCISTEIYQTLWDNRVEGGSLFPGNKHRSGHPVLISSALKPNIELEMERSSMKSLLKQFPVSFLELDDPNIHLDVDTPEAYQNLFHQK